MADARCQALKVKANSSVIIGFPLHQMFIICCRSCSSVFCLVSRQNQHFTSLHAYCRQFLLKVDGVAFTQKTITKKGGNKYKTLTSSQNSEKITTGQKNIAFTCFQFSPFEFIHQPTCLCVCCSLICNSHAADQVLKIIYVHFPAPCQFYHAVKRTWNK